MHRSATISRAILPIALFTCAGCAPAPGVDPVAVVVLPAARAAPVPAASAPPVSAKSGCAPFVEAVVAQLVEHIPVRDDFSPDWYRQGVCVESPHGAWAIVYENVKVDSGPAASELQAPYVGITAPWRLVHVDAAGRRASGSLGVIHIRPHAAESVRVVSVFDYDGDGVDEVLLTESSEGVDRGDSHGKLFSAHGDAVAPYAQAAAIDVDALEDVDGDGRPDLLVYGPYRAESDWCSWEPDRSQYVHLAAHARPDGSFSMTDDAAARYARTTCPSSPAPLTIGSLASDSMLAVRCARLWGLPAADALKAIQKTCTGQLPVCGKTGKGNCAHYLSMVAWAKADPPLKLVR